MGNLPADDQATDCGTERAALGEAAARENGVWTEAAMCFGISENAVRTALFEPGCFRAAPGRLSRPLSLPVGRGDMDTHSSPPVCRNSGLGNYDGSQWLSFRNLWKPDCSSMVGGLEEDSTRRCEVPSGARPRVRQGPAGASSPSRRDDYRQRVMEARCPNVVQ